MKEGVGDSFLWLRVKERPSNKVISHYSNKVCFSIYFIQDIGLWESLVIGKWSELTTKHLSLDHV